MTRANYLGAPAAFNLYQCILPVNKAFNTMCFLVGSCLEKRDYRDVDVRAILSDVEFATFFPTIANSKETDAHWSLTCSSISEWLSSRTGLPVDFQVQTMTEANHRFKGERQAIGMFFDKPTKEGGQ